MIAPVFLGYKALTTASLTFWPISERRKIDFKKGQTRADLDNIEIVAEHAAARNVQLAMPSKRGPALGIWVANY